MFERKLSFRRSQMETTLSSAVGAVIREEAFDGSQIVAAVVTAKTREM